MAGTSIGASMGLTLGNLPAGATYIQKLVKRLRKQLEQAVLGARGTVGIVDAAYINTACRAEASSRLAAKWLAEHEQTMDHAARLAYTKAIASASETRDKSIRALRLAPEDQDPMKLLQSEWQSWEQQQATAEPSQPHAIATETPETASETPNAAEASSEPPTHPDAMHDPDPFGPHS